MCWNYWLKPARTTANVQHPGTEIVMSPVSASDQVSPGGLYLMCIIARAVNFALSWYWRRISLIFDRQPCAIRAQDPCTILLG